MSPTGEDGHPHPLRGCRSVPWCSQGLWQNTPKGRSWGQCAPWWPPESSAWRGSCQEGTLFPCSDPSVPPCPVQGAESCNGACGTWRLAESRGQGSQADAILLARAEVPQQAACRRALCAERSPRPGVRCGLCWASPRWDESASRALDSGEDLPQPGRPGCGQQAAGCKEQDSPGSQ